jgi:hypothetical protein
MGNLKAETREERQARLNPTCASCRYAKPIPRHMAQTQLGAAPDLSHPEEILCRRYPPTFITTVEGMWAPSWPKLVNDCWCGEYAPRKNDG